MTILFQHQQHPRVSERRATTPPRSTDPTPSINGRVAILLTRVVGTMWCAYAFGVLALVALPDALASGNRIAGPALVEEYASTTVVQPGDALRVDAYGNLVIRIGRG